MPHAALRRAGAATAPLILSMPPVHPQDEVRALCVVWTTLASPSAIATTVASARSGGLGCLPQVGRAAFQF